MRRSTRHYLAAGADIVETNTFGATRVAQEDYGLGHVAREMNVAAARLAREACDKFTQRRQAALRRRRARARRRAPPASARTSTTRRRATSRSTSCARPITSRPRAARRRLRPVPGRDHLRHAERQGRDLRARRADGGDRRAPAGDRLGHRHRCIGPHPVRARRCRAFWHSVRHARPLAVGLNCALGAALMRPYIEELAKVAGDTFVSCYPNAGLPNPMSETGFDETPEVTGALIEEFAQGRLPQHRRRLLRHDARAHRADRAAGRPLPAALPAARRAVRRARGGVGCVRRAPRGGRLSYNRQRRPRSAATAGPRVRMAARLGPASATAPTATALTRP